MTSINQSCVKGLDSGLSRQLVATVSVCKITR
jgi:hypothetical protein